MLIPRKRPAAGFTLIELVIFIVVIALALTGTILVINQSVTLAPQALVKTRAMEIAQAYLDEIATKKYDENTGQGGLPACDSAAGPNCTNERACGSALNPTVLFGPDNETRSTYNDVDDYHCTDDNPPVDAAGNSNPDYADYRVQISVSYAGNDLGLADNRYAKLINLLITTPFGDTIPVSYYRTNY